MTFFSVVRSKAALQDALSFRVPTPPLQLTLCTASPTTATWDHQAACNTSRRGNPFVRAPQETESGSDPN